MHTAKRARPFDPDGRGPSNSDGRMLTEVLYGMDGIARSHPVVNGGRFGLGVRLFHRLYFTADYTVSERLEIKSQRVLGTLRLTRHPVGIGVRWYPFSRARWRLGGGVLMEIDIFLKEISSDDPDVKTSRSGTQVQLGIVPSLASGLHLAGPLYAALHIGMRIVTDKVQYFEKPSPEEARSSLYSPWRVQTRLSLGLYVLLF